jgi:hypothetical protein
MINSSACFSSATRRRRWLSRFVRTLRISEKTLGPDHDDVAENLSALATR